MRLAARKDANQSEIVKGLRIVGVKVYVLNNPDIPDLLTGFRGKLRLIEIKDGAKYPSQRKLRKGQQAFFSEWQDYPICVVSSLAEALEAHGIWLTT